MLFFQGTTPQQKATAHTSASGTSIEHVDVGSTRLFLSRQEAPAHTRHLSRLQGPTPTHTSTELHIRSVTHSIAQARPRFTQSLAHSFRCLSALHTNRNVTTGLVIANVSESLRHSFFAAVADHNRRIVWVFGSAHARGNKIKPNLCDVRACLLPRFCWSCSVCVCVCVGVGV
jgi:hypothetical protein